MKIAFIVSEVEDIIKTGGLADVAKALPLAYAALGHEVVIVMPAYKTVIDQFNLHSHGEFNSSHQQFTRYEYQLGAVKVHLVGHACFNRAGLYAENNVAYTDNGERFGLFSAAVIDILQVVDFQPDMMHCNDWHTGLVPFFVKHNKTQFAEGFFAHTKTTLTIHNAAFQGSFNLHEIPMIENYHQALHLNLNPHINMMKIGITYADKITAVSPTYAQEILTNLGGHGMHLCLQNRSSDLKGILNGCDYTQWDPSTDPFIDAHYDVNDLSGKAICKQALQAESGFADEPKTPLIGMVCRLTAQKGFDYILPILGELMQHNLQLTIVGTGDPYVCHQLADLSRVHPTKFKFIEGFKPELAHLVEAGSDFFLMPSEFEPCGLNQMYSLAYGTLPIVRNVGGLSDTVVGIDQNAHDSTGFMFTDPEPIALLICIRRALLLYLEQPDQFLQMQKRAMHTKFTWEKAAKEFEVLFINTIQ